jgi:hypothetical protein
VRDRSLEHAWFWAVSPGLTSRQGAHILLGLGAVALGVRLGVLWRRTHPRETALDGGLGEREWALSELSRAHGVPCYAKKCHLAGHNELRAPRAARRRSHGAHRWAALLHGTKRRPSPKKPDVIIIRGRSRKMLQMPRKGSGTTPRGMKRWSLKASAACALPRQANQARGA